MSIIHVDKTEEAKDHEAIKDPFRIWERFCATMEEAFNWLADPNKDRFRQDAQSDAMVEFNTKRGHYGTPMACSGIVTKERARGEKFTAHQCHELFCPAFWMICQVTIQDLVQKLEAPFWHLRTTNYLEWDQDFAPETLRAFKASKQGMHLVGWTIAVEAGTKPDTGAPTCFYRYVGIWVSKEQVTPKNFESIRDGRIVAWVNHETFTDKQALEQEWVDANPHPGHLRDHKYYEGYLFGLNGRTVRRLQTGGSRVSKYLGIIIPSVEADSKNPKNHQKSMCCHD